MASDYTAVDEEDKKKDEDEFPAPYGFVRAPAGGPPPSLDAPADFPAVLSQASAPPPSIAPVASGYEPPNPTMTHSAPAAIMPQPPAPHVLGEMPTPPVYQ